MEKHVRGVGPVYRSERAASSQDHPAETKITVLTSVNGRRATKHFTPRGVKRYAGEKNWYWREEAVTSLADLARVLGGLEHDRLSLVVLGAVTDAWRDRAIIPRTKVGDEPSLADIGSRVVHFDLDEIRLPTGSGWHDPEGVARRVWQTVIARKVPAFADVGFFWQASSSAGTPGEENKAKLHLWALLDQPIDEARRRALLGMAGADDSLATINQPNYTARPVFDGVPDPLSGVARSGVITGGRDCAEVEAIAWPRQPKRPKRQARQTGELPEGFDGPTRPAGEKLLRSACRKITKLKAGGRNNKIYQQAKLIGGYVAGGAINREEARRALLEAGLASGHDRYAEAVANGLTAGLRRPLTPPDQPFWPAPSGDRDAAIAAHPETIRAWGEQNIPIMQATRAVAEAYAAIEDDLDPDRDLREVRRQQAAIRRQVRAEFNLDFLPASRVTKSTPISRVMLTGAQGVGKTQAVVGGILHEARGLISIVFQPSHNMAEQALYDYEENARDGSPKSFLLRGRTAPNPSNPTVPMCRLASVASRLAASGVSVPEALCKTCPFADGCAYLTQAAEMRNLREGVIFAPHDYAFLPLPGGVEPDLMIFDERPRDMGVEPVVEISLDDLGKTLPFDPASHGIEADAYAANLQFIRPLMIALRDAAQNHPHRILAALRDRGVNRDMVRGALEGLALFQDRKSAEAMRRVVSEWTFSGQAFELQDRLAKAAGSGEMRLARRLQAAFSAILTEIDKPRDAAIGIVAEDRKEQRDRSVSVTRLRQLRVRDVPFLHLDGTGDHAMAEAVFGALRLEEHRVDRSPAGRGDRITQVVGRTFHTSGLVGGPKGRGGQRVLYHGDWRASYDRQRENIRKIIASRPSALVVASKEVIETLNPSNPHAHFGDIRGRNDWETIDQIIVIGRDQPSPDAIEMMARAFAATGEDFVTGDYEAAQRGIRLLDGSIHPATVDCHPDPWADRVLRQVREAEITQAIDRVRPIFKSQPIEVLLLSPVVVDLTVTDVADFDDLCAGGSRVQRALAEHGVLPLSKHEAARLLPGIWASAKTADRDLAEVLTSHDPGSLGQTINRDFYLRNDPIFVAAYRAAPSGASQPRRHRALISAPASDVRAVLEALTGPLAEFEILETVEAADAPKTQAGLALSDVQAPPTGVSRVDLALSKSGVLPLSGREAARLFPDIWASKDAADRDIKKADLVSHGDRLTSHASSFGSSGSVQISRSAAPSGTLTPLIATYRLPGKRAREHQVIIHATPENARATLERLTGPVATFELLSTRKDHHHETDETKTAARG